MLAKKIFQLRKVFCVFDLIADIYIRKLVPGIVFN